MRNGRFLAVTAAVMIGLPWAAVTFAPGDAGMAIAFLLFFALDPVYAVAAGWLAGQNVRKFWVRPTVTAVLFLLGCWLMFDPGEPAFVRYALTHLALGYGTMGVRKIIKK